MAVRTVCPALELSIIEYLLIGPNGVIRGSYRPSTIGDREMGDRGERFGRWVDWLSSRLGRVTSLARKQSAAANAAYPSSEEPKLKARQTRLLAVILALALPAAACGGGGESTADTSASTATTQAVASTATAAPAAPATTAAPAAASTTTPPAATTTAAEPTGDSTDGIELEITAVNLVFSTDVLNTTAGVRTTVIFTHNDEEAHNFHVRAVDQPLIESKAGDLVADVFTAIMQPPSSERLTFTIAEAGEYLFFCDTHPLDMTGTLVVSP